jgi:hypothetical protein
VCIRIDRFALNGNNHISATTTTQPLWLVVYSELEKCVCVTSTFVAQTNTVCIGESFEFSASTTFALCALHSQESRVMGWCVIALPVDEYTLQSKWLCFRSSDRVPPSTLATMMRVTASQNKMDGLVEVAESVRFLGDGLSNTTTTTSSSTAATSTTSTMTTMTTPTTPTLSSSSVKEWEHWRLATLVVALIAMLALRLMTM